MPLAHPLLPPILEASSHRSEHYPRRIGRLLAASRRIKILGRPFISGAIRTLCAPSVSRETAGSGYHPSSFDIRYPATVPASQQRLQIGGPSASAAAGLRSAPHADLTASIRPMARGSPASSERRNYGTSHVHRSPEPLASYLRFHVKPPVAFGSRRGSGADVGSMDADAR